MSKQPRDRNIPKAVREERELIPVRYQHAAALLVLLIALVAFFAPVVFSDKTFQSPDTIASHSWDTALKDAAAEGVFPLWNPYIFCGMPGYASLTFGGERLFDLSGVAFTWLTRAFNFLMLNSPVGWVIFYYFIFGAGMYLLAFDRTRSRLAALIASLAVVFSTYIIVWVMIGHNTKISVIAFFPLILFAVERLRQRFNLWHASGLVLLLHFAFLPSHVQMIFYMYLALGIYYLWFLAHSLVTKADWKGVIRSGLVLVFATALAFAMDADKYLSVWEYNPYSMRGSAPAVATPETGAKTQQGGLDYDYATSWSFGPGEMMTFVIPTWYGFGPLEYQGQLSSRPVPVNMYWGPQPFVDGAQYMGIVVLVLAVIGFIRNRKDPFVQFAGVTIVLALLISFGKELPLLFDPMFRYFPMFNKFRVPVMILILVQLFVPLLAAYGVANLVSVKNFGTVAMKRWKTVLVGLAGLFAVALLGRGIVTEVYGMFFPVKEVAPHIARMAGSNQPAVVNELYSFVAGTVASDVAFAALFLLIAFGGIYLHARGKAGLSVVALGLILAVMGDLWRVDKRPMDPHDRAASKQVFATPEYVKFLQQDTTMYRTLTFINGQPPYDNTLAYWRIQSAYGYQGAKMRAYQDIVDVAGLGNPLVWQLMNVKYLLTNRPDSSAILEQVYSGPDMLVYRNRAAAPRAFFVDRYEVADSKQILDRMAQFAFKPTEVAYVSEDPKVKVEPARPDASARITQYGLQDLTVDVNATGNNLLFLSEAYYPLGWKASIDGAETPIYRLDYLFRGVVVPPGKHTLRMSFDPQSFSFGRTVSLAANVLVLAGGAVLLLVTRRKRTPPPTPAA